MEFSLDRLFQVAAVEQACQWVTKGLVAKSLLKVEVGKRNSDVLRDRTGEL
jgi:hypothetical protein